MRQRAKYVIANSTRIESRGGGGRVTPEYRVHVDLPDGDSVTGDWWHNREYAEEETLHVQDKARARWRMKRWRLGR